MNVDSALDLPSDSMGPHRYCTTASYVGEPQDEVDSRRTQGVRATPSATTPGRENCVFHQHIRVPYNSRQQFLMVSVYELDFDAFVGQATIPLAEQRLSATSPWPLIRDGLQTGTVTLNVQLPGAAPEQDFSRAPPNMHAPPMQRAGPWGRDIHDDPQRHHAQDELQRAPLPQQQSMLQTFPTPWFFR